MTPLEADLRDNRLRRIRTGAKIVKWVLTVCTAALFALGLGLFLSVLFPTLTPFNGEDAIYVGDMERSFLSMSFVQRALLSLLVAISFFLLVNALWTLRALCARYQNLDFFSPSTLKRMIMAGVWLISFAFFDVASDPVAALVATMDFPETQRIVDVTVDGGEISCLILGALMLVLGWILREAALLAEENRQII